MQTIDSRAENQFLSHPARVALLTGLVAVGVGAWSVTGTVKNVSGAALVGVAVSVKDSSASLGVTSGSTGAFSVVGATGVGLAADRSSFSVRREAGDLVIQHPGGGRVGVSLVDLSGALLWQTDATLNHGVARVAIPSAARVNPGILRVRSGSEVVAQMVILQGIRGWRLAPQPVAARWAATFPVLLFKKSGYRDTSFAMTAESMTGVAMVMRDTGGPQATAFVEDRRDACVIPTLPAVSALPNVAALTNPFKMLDGTAVTTKVQWNCRREEIGAMVEKYIMGDKPRHPTKVTGAWAGNKLTITVTDKGKSISFDVTITKPAGAGPFPAVIGYGGGNLGSSYSNMGVATISYDNFIMASEGSGRGKGKFYDLYGSTATAGELMAWAWGVSRIIDALVATPAVGIDPRKIAVTGCSRNGKGAIVAGAFDHRIALTIPQESGSGGVSAWRIVATYSDAQPISSAAGEQSWMRADFGGNFSNAPGKLPVDHHEMSAMVAPNGLLVLDNSIAWLGPKAGYGTTVAVKEIFTALGAAQAVTYSSVGGHDHCTLPASQNHWVQSYVKQHLLGQTGEAAKMEAPADYTFDRAKWITWTTPTLK